MKVEMSIKDGSYKAGMFKSKPCQVFTYTVEMTHTELAAIKKLGLEQHKMFDYLPADPKERTLFAELSRNDKGEGYFNRNGSRGIMVIWLCKEQQPVTASFPVETLLEAQDMMAKFKTSLVALKDAMGRADAPKSESFEL